MSRSPCVSCSESRSLCNHTVLSPDARIVCEQLCGKILRKGGSDHVTVTANV
jgi:hypothetical protein